MAPDGAVPFTAADIQAGQELFRKHDLMNCGSVLGHGTYLGPDYTAESLHRMTQAMQETRTGGAYGSLGASGKAAVDAAIEEELKANRYDARAGVLTSTLGRMPMVRI